MLLYKYGMRLRGFSIGCQPMKNLYDWKDNSEKYHSVLWYTEKLADGDLENYELDYIGEEDR